MPISIGVILALLAAARLLLWFAPTARWTDQVFRLAALGPVLRTLLRTPIDFLLTMATIAAFVVLAFDLVERLRRTLRHRLPPPESRQDWSVFGITQLGAGAAVALLLVGYEVLLGNAISATSVDALHFSLHPLVSARLAFALGLLLAQAVVFWSGSVIVMMMTLPWRAPRSGGIALAAFALQALPVLAISIFPRVIGAAPSTVPAVPMPSVAARATNTQIKHRRRTWLDLADDRLLDVCGQVTQHRVHLVADLLGGDIRVFVQLELDNNLRHAFTRHRVQVVHARDLVDCAFDLIRDVGLDLLWGCPGETRRHHNHRNIDVGELIDRKATIPEDAEHDEPEHHHRREDRPLDRDAAQSGEIGI